MKKIIDTICYIFNVSKENSSKIYKDDFEQVYVINADKRGVACVLASRDSYIYSIYIFAREKYQNKITKMFLDLCEDIEDYYGDDRRIYADPIDINSDIVNDCILVAKKFGYINLLKEYLK